MDDLLWIDAQKFIDLAITVTAVIAGLIVVQAAYLLLLAIVLTRTKHSTKKQ